MTGQNLEGGKAVIRNGSAPKLPEIRYGCTNEKRRGKYAMEVSEFLVPANISLQRMKHASKSLEIIEPKIPSVSRLEIETVPAQARGSEHCKDTGLSRSVLYARYGNPKVNFWLVHRGRMDEASFWKSSHTSVQEPADGARQRPRNKLLVGCKHGARYAPLDGRQGEGFVAQIDPRIACFCTVVTVRPVGKSCAFGASYAVDCYCTGQVGRWIFAAVRQFDQCE